MAGSENQKNGSLPIRAPIWSGVLSAFFLAAGGSGLLGLSLYATARLLRSESLGFAQQSVGDTHRLLSSQIQRELTGLQEGLARVGEVLLRNTLEKSGLPASGVDPAGGDAVLAPALLTQGKRQGSAATGIEESRAGDPSGEKMTAGGAHLEKLRNPSVRKPAARGKAVVAAKLGGAVKNPQRTTVVSSGAGGVGAGAPLPGAEPAPVLAQAPTPIPHLPQGVIQVSLWAQGLGESSPSVRAESFLNPRYASQGAQLKSLLRGSESLDRALVEEAFKSGRGLLFARNVKNTGRLGGHVVSVALQFALPPSTASTRAVLLGHYRLDAIDAMLNADLLARSMLLDARGRSLAGETAIGQGAAKALILDAVRGRKERTGLVQDFSPGTSLGPDSPLFASFTHFQQFPLSLITVIREGDVLTGMDSLARIAIASVIAVFLILFVIAFSQTRRQWQKLQQSGAHSNASGSVISDALGPAGAAVGGSGASAEAKGELSDEGGRRVYGSVLVVTLRGLQGNLDQAPLLLSVSELLRDFRGLLASAVTQSGGEWIQDLDGSFAVAFEDPMGVVAKGETSQARAVAEPLPVSETAAFRCVQLALALRKQWHLINTTRATEGHAPAFLGMAVHAAHGLKISKTEGFPSKFITPIVHEARTLERLAASLGQDLLIPKNVFEILRLVLKVDLAGEAYLGDVSGLTAYYRVLGYLKGENGQEELIETPWMKTPVEGRASAIQMVEGAVRWFINNGSGIIGPFSPAEISAQLFAQEIDFDCECWREDRGETRSIRESDLFTGSEDSGAVFWVYDGKWVHGPLSPGFLATALRTGAIRAAGSFWCEGSTIAGWRPLESWVPATSASSSEASSNATSASSTTPTPGASSAA